MVRRRWLTRALAALVVLVVVAGVALYAATRKHPPNRVTATGKEPTTTTSPSGTTSTTGIASGSEAPTTTTAVAPGGGEPSTTEPVETSTTTPTPPPAFGPNALLLMSIDQQRKSIWAIDPDGTGKTLLLDGADVWDIGWAPGHQQFAWHDALDGPQGRQLHIVNVDGSGDHVVAQRPPAGEAMAGWYGLWWSPDGRTIAQVCKVEEPHHWQPLCVLDVETGELRDLVTEFGLIGPDDVGADGLKPWFYPLGFDLTGRRLVYARAPEAPVVYVDVFDLETGAHWTIATEDAIVSGVVEGDGETVLYERTDGVGGLKQVPITGGTPQPASGLPPTDRSPDGQWFLSSSPGREPTIFNLAGDQRRIENLPPNVWSARW